VPAAPIPADRDPLIVDLADSRARDIGLVGAKAAGLARARAAGLPIVPGVVLTTAATDQWSPGEAPSAPALQALRVSIEGLVRDHNGPVVVRSSSTIEDAQHSSMAGRFRSILGVVGWDGVVNAVRAVRDSAVDGAASGCPPAPIAVLIQPEVAADHGGVLFGLEPVSGDPRHLVIEVAAGNPSDLVSGRVAASHLLVTRRGRLTSCSGAGPPLPRRERRALVRLARRAEQLFHGPQDIEWACDADGGLWLLQSRPITAIGESGPHGTILGPGPVAETFPEPLRRLEVDLWLRPLREGIVHALHVTGAVSRRRLAASPVVTVVDGWAAADLELLGHRRRRTGVLNPVAGARRLGAAWRVGRLRVALPPLIAQLLARVDGHLADVPPFDQLGNDELVTLLERARDELVAVHGYEVLAGMLLPADPDCAPAPAVALSVLARARAAGQPDAVTVLVDPVVLTLVAPTVGGAVGLPPTPPVPVIVTGARLDPRDALRLRSRWLQELSGRAAGRLAERLTSAGTLIETGLVRELDVAELRAVVSGAPPPPDIAERAARPAGPPLPIEFRLGATGDVFAVRRGTVHLAGLGAGGGRAVGLVRHRPPPVGSRHDAVLVVRTLDPGLAGVLPSLVGLVSETGSALSHLAILARELGVATVVGVPAARQRFPAGSRVIVDGLTGQVSMLDDTPDDAGGP
jgi:pyruvate,water dikinase